jgi:hypothetical protein
MSRRQALIAACSIVAFAFALRMLAWFAYPNQLWPDEHFQSLEQAHRVVFGYGVVPWEFREGTRSWLLPGTLAGVMAATSVVTSSVIAYLAGCAAVLSAIAVAPMWATFKSALSEFGWRGALVAAGLGALWFELIFFAPKALNEAVAGNLLVVGALLADGCVRATRGGEPVRARTVIVTAAVLALASVLRIQLAIAGVAAFAYLFRYVPARVRWQMVGAGAAVVGFAGLLDWLTWDYPFQSYIENIRVNILVGRSETYGTAPWYAYFAVYGRIWGIWTIVVLALAALGARRRPLLAICALAVLVAHVPIAHKEYRFAYPAMALVIALAGFGAAQLVQWVERKRNARLASLTAAGILAVWLSASLQCADGFHESKTRLAVTFGESDSHWSWRRGALLSTLELGADPTVCGIGLIGINVFSTGGYTYLHRRDVPFFEALNRQDITGLSEYVNAWVVAASIVPGDHFNGFTKDRCIAEACIFRRPGTCKLMPGYSFNQVLRARGH